MGDPLGCQVVSEGDAEYPLVLPGKMIFTNIKSIGKDIQIDFFHIVFVYIFPDQLHFSQNRIILTGFVAV